MFKSIEAEFAYFNALSTAKGTVRRCTRNAWINGLKQGCPWQVLIEAVLWEISEIIIEDFAEFAGDSHGQECISELTNVLKQELDELANLQN